MISEIIAILPAEGPDFSRTTVGNESMLRFLGKLGLTTADLNKAFEV